MAHYAKLDENNIVLQVNSVRDQDCLDENGQESEDISIAFLEANGHTGRWVKTSYGTRMNIHYNTSTNQPDEGIPFRVNYAGIGYTYDPFRDAFIPPKPEDVNNPNRYILDEKTCVWIDTLADTITINMEKPKLQITRL